MCSTKAVIFDQIMQGLKAVITSSGTAKLSLKWDHLMTHLPFGEKPALPWIHLPLRS